MSISRQRLISYDNAHGRADHRHYGEFGEPYDFTTPGQLIEDYLTDVQNARGP